VSRKISIDKGGVTGGKEVKSLKAIGGGRDGGCRRVRGGRRNLLHKAGKKGDASYGHGEPGLTSAEPGMGARLKSAEKDEPAMPGYCPVRVTRKGVRLLIHHQNEGR